MWFVISRDRPVYVPVNRLGQAIGTAVGVVVLLIYWL